jgi:hypothetical protein
MTLVNPKVDLQQIRKRVLHSQLLALDMQAQALTSMASEHEGGLNLGANPEIAVIVGQVKDISEVARKFVHEVAVLSREEIVARLEALQATAISATNLSQVAYDHAQIVADRRLDVTLADNLTADEEPTRLPVAPTESRLLFARAGMCCHMAEMDLNQSFKIQVRAICDLALELAFTAAAQVGSEFPSDSNYWVHV